MQLKKNSGANLGYMHLKCCQNKANQQHKIVMTFILFFFLSLFLKILSVFLSAPRPNHNVYTELQSSTICGLETIKNVYEIK